MKNPYLENKFFENYFQSDEVELSLGDWNKAFRKDIMRLLSLKDILIFDDLNGVGDLENLHLSVDKKLFDYSMDKGVNPLTIKFYDTDDHFLRIYYDFLRALKTELGFDFYFQATPTIRFHAPKVKNEFHFPIFHNDPMVYGHPPEEINVWFSLTKNKHSGFYMIDRKNSEKWFAKYSFDVDRFIKESSNEEGFAISREIKSNLNSVYLFDSLCIHTTKPRTEETRISIDVRINPVDQFVSGYIGLGNMKADFKPDGKFGYHGKSIGELS